MELAKAKRVVDSAVSNGEMALVVGRCRVQYEGRAASKLSHGDRLLVVKHDGTFLVHQSKSMKAVNYQGPGALITTRLSDDGKELVVSADRKKPKEHISVQFHEVVFARSFKLRDDTSLKLFGTEKELAALLLQDLHLIEPGLVPVKRESWLPKGSIDILARDGKGRLVVIELKRRTAGLAAATQLKRYVGEVTKRKEKGVRGILAAPSITPNALKMIEGEGLEFFKLEYEISNPSSKIVGLEKKQKSLVEF